MRDTAAALLHVTPRTAWEYLNRLSRNNRLTKVGVRYYPAGKAVAEADYLPILRAYIQKEGTAAVRPWRSSCGSTPSRPHIY